MAKNTPNTENIFNITQPNEYQCQLIHYHNRLSRLYLAVYKGQQKNPAFYLLFSDVGYLELPANWYGANFCTDTQEACLELMLERGLVGESVLQFPEAYAPITNYARLYYVNTPKAPVRLIASSASLLQSLPSELT